jgi:hypothetical protein
VARNHVARSLHENRAPDVVVNAADSTAMQLIARANAIGTVDIALQDNVSAFPASGVGPWQQDRTVPFDVYICRS